MAAHTDSVGQKSRTPSLARPTLRAATTPAGMLTTHSLSPRWARDPDKPIRIPHPSGWAHDGDRPIRIPQSSGLARDLNKPIRAIFFTTMIGSETHDPCQPMSPISESFTKATG